MDNGVCRIQGIFYRIGAMYERRLYTGTNAKTASKTIRTQTLNDNGHNHNIGHYLPCLRTPEIRRDAVRFVLIFLSM
jgi:hypothetical protein